MLLAAGDVLMAINTPLSWEPNLQDAIEHQPLTVLPTTPLVEVVALISQAHAHICAIVENSALPESPKRSVRASCVLVMRDQELLGILTERDVVRLAAQSIDLTAVSVADVMVSPVITLPHRSLNDIFAALFLFRRYRIRHLPIVDEEGQLVGVISHESIRHILRPANLLQFRRVGDVMTTQVIHAPLTATVLQIAQLMVDHRVSCIVIVQTDAADNHKPVGIVTERDIVQLQALQIDFPRTQAQTVMSTPLFLLNPEDSLWTAYQEMQNRRVGRLVVSWNWGKSLGIITQTSLLRVFDPMEMYAVIENLQQTIQQLESEQSSLLPTSQLLPPAAPPDPQLVPSHWIDGGDREHLLSLINSTHQDIRHLMNDQEIVVDFRQSLLQSVLDKLERIDRGIRY